MSRLFKIAEKIDDKYVKKVQIPQYLPNSIKPKLYELCDLSKYKELLKNINLSSLNEDEKEFLKLAATRHIVFNYSKIADYYANSDAETQVLMEQSALVILDINDAIANGYVKLSKNIKKILEESGRYATEE